MTAAAAPRLVAITDLTRLDPLTLLTRLRALAEAARPSSVALLLRDHATSGRERLGLGQKLVSIARATGQLVWVADRIDLALLLDADGLHLGEGSVDAHVARRLWSRERYLSRAWHRTEAPAPSELSAIDALVLSPLLAERKGRAALGLAALARLRQALPTLERGPALYALGGVSADSAAECLRAGADGVAAIGASLEASPSALVRALGITR